MRKQQWNENHLYSLGTPHTLTNVKILQNTIYIYLLFLFFFTPNWFGMQILSRKIRRESIFSNYLHVNSGKSIVWGIPKRYRLDLFGNISCWKPLMVSLRYVMCPFSGDVIFNIRLRRLRGNRLLNITHLSCLISL